MITPLASSSLHSVSPFAVHASPEGDPTPTGSASTRVLYVDDNQICRQVIAMALERMGIGVDLASDGPEAETMYLRSPSLYSLIITDHEMPLMLGSELVHRLAMAGFSGKLAVCSAADPIELRRAYANLKIDAFLGKPITRDELVAAVEALGVTANRLVHL